MRALLDVVLMALELFSWMIIASAVLSWLIAFNVINMRNDFVRSVCQGLYRITEPVMRPLRRVLPYMGGVDLSPIVVLLAIMFLEKVIVYYIYPNVF
ncbi:MAG: YggT family protein [Rhizobiales bacterium]|jgi:YggT family protein|nr:YggT family protein [Hyphomicrobiales bacterium]